MQSPKTHVAVPQPENGNSGHAALVPGMAILIDADLRLEEGLDHNDDQDQDGIIDANLRLEEGHDHNDDQGGIDDKKCKTYLPPPGIEDARHAHEDLQAILKPKRKTGYGHVDPGFSSLM